MDRNHGITAKTLKNPYRSLTVMFKLSLKGKKTKIRIEKTKSYVPSGFGNGISPSLEQKSTTGRFAVGRF